MSDGDAIRRKVTAVKAGDGVRLTVRRDDPPIAASPRGTVVALHGIQSHGGWYRRSSAAIAASGWRALWPDRRGSGWSEHATGDADRLIDDVERLLDDPALVSPPVVLLGVSWGAKLATAVAVRRPVAGLAWVNPGLFSRFTPSAPARLASRLLPGDLEVPIPLNDPALFTDDPARRAMIAADPHARRTADMTLLRATTELDRRLAARTGRLDMPLLVQLAGRDQIVDNRRTRDRAETLAADVTVREYADARHTLEFSAAADDAAADLVAWLGRLRADARGPDGRGGRDDRPQ